MDLLGLGKKIAGAGANLLGAAIGGKGGAALTSIVAQALGVEANTEEAIAQAIDRDPEAGAKLLKVERDSAAELQRLVLQETQIYLADVQGARDRNLAVVQATGKNETFLYGLAASIVVVFTAIVGVLIFHPVAANVSSVLFAMLGSLATAFVTVVNFFFGSSKGSSQKTAALQAQLDKVGPAGK